MIRIIPGVALGLLIAVAAVAADVGPDKVGMERKVRKLGIGIGNAYVCADEKAQDTMKNEVHHLFDLIIQDVGSDLGFVYASGIGYGSSVPKENLDCPKLLKQWEQVRVDYELKEDN